MNSARLFPSRLEFLTLLLLCLAYSIPVVSCWNLGYLDFGDGNYMYISWRVSQGAVLYRDILAPQPPLHLYIGAGIAWLGDHFLSHPIWAFRTFSLTLHLATMLLLWSTTKTLFAYLSPRKNTAISLVASAIYLVLPIGFWWTLGYQSQPLLIFLLLLMFRGVLRNTNHSTILSAVAAGLALLTNMTTAPYVLFTAGWLLLRRTRHGLIFTLVTALFPLTVIPIMEVTTNAYISNVIQNQVGSFPRADVLAQNNQTIAGLIFGKWINEGNDVLRLESAWIVLGLIGMIIYGFRQRNPHREYPLFFSFFSLCSILYVAKGGTVDYVFSLGEPYVAMFAALMVTTVSTMLHRLWAHRTQPLHRDLTPLAVPLLSTGLLISIMLPGMAHNILTLQQRTYELNEAETLRIVNQIRANSHPNDEIIAPPHLAFLAKRKIAQDYSEHFLWRLKYMNERLDNKEDRAVQTIKALAGQLDRKEIPFLVLDLNQTGTLPEIVRSVEANYRPLMDKPLQTLNTPLQFYKPLTK